MKTIFLFSIVLFFLSRSYSQVFSPIVWGPEESSTTIIKVIGKNASGLFTLVERKNEYFLQKCDPNTLVPASEYLISLPMVDKIKIELLGVHMIGGSIHLIGKDHDFTDQSERIFSYSMDDQGVISPSGQLVLQYKVPDVANRGKTTLQLAETGDYLLISHRSDNYHGKFALLNQKGEIVKQDEIEQAKHPKGMGEAFFTGFCVDNEANVHAILLGSQESGNFDLYTWFSGDGYQLTKSVHYLLQEGQISPELHISSSNGVLKITGIYFAKGGVKGAFIVYRNKDATDQVTVSPFSEKTRIKSHAGELEREHDPISLHYHVKEVLTDSAGFTWMILEKDFVNADGMRYHGSLIIAKFTPDGTLLWDKLYPKASYSKDEQAKDGSMLASVMIGVATGILFNYSVYPVFQPGTSTTQQSFKAWLSNGKAVILFNDNPENVDKKQGELRRPVDRSTKAVPFLMTVDADGNCVYDMMKELDGKGLAYRLPKAIVMGKDLLLIAVAKKSEKLVKLGLNN